MHKWFNMAFLLVVGIVLVGCSGVTPSLKVGALHRATDAQSQVLASTTGAIKLEALGYGGSIELKFAENGIVVVPCGLLVHTSLGSKTKKAGDDEDFGPFYETESFYMTEIPGQLCVEVDTAKLSN